MSGGEQSAPLDLVSLTRSSSREERSDWSVYDSVIGETSKQIKNPAPSI